MSPAPHTRLTRFGARDYDAATGRWMSKDPAGLSTSVNLFSYASNTPNSKYDPIGLWAVQIGVGAAAGFVYGVSGQAGFAFDSELNFGEFVSGEFMVGPYVTLGTGFFISIFPDAPDITALDGSGSEVAFMGGPGSVSLVTSDITNHRADECAEGSSDNSSYEGLSIGLGAEGLGAGVGVGRSITKMWKANYHGPP